MEQNELFPHIKRRKLSLTGMEVEIYPAELEQEGVVLSPTVAYNISDKSGLVFPKDLGPVKLLIRELWTRSYILPVLDIATKETLNDIDFGFSHNTQSVLSKNLFKRNFVITSTTIVSSPKLGWIYKVSSKLLKLMKKNIFNN